jgi:oleate hydratase
MPETRADREPVMYLIGSGIASLAAAAFLIRDGGIPGHNIKILEESPTIGGSLDAAGTPKDGYVMRGGRMLESKYLCTVDLFSSIPTLDERKTVTQEIFERNEMLKTSSKSRLFRDGHRVNAPKFGLSERYILTIEALGFQPEAILGRNSIADQFDPSFFETDFWFMWCSTFAFQPWHSAVEFKRYLVRFTHMVSGFNTLIIDSQNVNVAETYFPIRALRGDCAAGPLLPDGTCQAQTSSSGGDNIPIHENWGLFGLWLQPSPKFRANFNGEVMYADNAFTRISPLRLQHYRVRATYRPQKWLDIAGSVNLLESSNDQSNNQQHSRNYSISAMMTRSDRWSFDVNYAYDDVFSRTDICYVSSAAPVTTPACPTDPAPFLLGNAYYNQPTNFGSASIMLHPSDRVTAYIGYNVSSVNGQAEMLNPRQVPGSLQSLYQSHFGRMGVTLIPRLTWNGQWCFKEYNESSPVGPTSPRNFRGNIYTLSLRYSY